MNGENPPKLDAQTPVMVVLPLGGWTGILSLLSKNPWDQVNGYMTAIQMQLQRAADQRQSPPNPAPQARTMVKE